MFENRLLRNIGKKLVRTLPLPISITVEPTTLCNLKCQNCRRGYWSNPSGSKHLELPKYKEVVKSVGWLPMVAFVGPDGEPLCNPDFNKLIEYNSSKLISTAITTNTTLITPSIVKFWKKHKVARVVASVDSCDPDEYEAIRVGASFSKVVENCKLITSEGIPLQMNMILLEENADRVLDYVKLAHSLGAFKIYFLKPHYIGDHDSSHTPKRNPQREMLMKQTLAYLKANKMNWNDPIGYGAYFRPCTTAFTYPYVAIDGGVRACCLMFGNFEEFMDGAGFFPVKGDNYVLGNLLEESFWKVWFGKRAQRLRKLLKETELPTGTTITTEELIKLRLNPTGNSEFEFCKSCLWRWSMIG